MKYTFILAVLGLACTNPKVKIVNKQIQVKQQLETAEKDKRTFIFLKDSYETMRKSADALNLNQDTIKILESNIVLVDDSIWATSEKISKLKSEYDSLEMELKKY